ncbi:MAG: hypothetical protein RL399_163, partial [Actinomycetota bacterium]
WANCPFLAEKLLNKGEEGREKRWVGEEFKEVCEEGS